MKKYILILIIISNLISTESFGQCEGYSNYPEGETAAKSIFEAYQERMEVEDFEVAYGLWQKVYKYAPAGNVAHYLDGVKIYKALMRKATDSETVVNYQSELLRLYDRRMKCFGYPLETENLVLSEKAVEMYHINYDENVTLRTFKYVLETEEMRYSPEFIAIYGTFSTYLFGGDKIDLFHLWESRQQLNKVLEYNFENTKDSAVIEEYQKAKATIDGYYNLYLDHENSCTEVVNVFKKIYINAESDSLKNIAYESLQALNCIEAFEAIETLRQTPIGSIEDSDIGKELKQLENTTNLASKTAKKAALAYNRNQYLLAAQLYEQALTETGNNTFKARYAYRIAEIYFNKINNKSEARQYAILTMNLDPSWGMPYFLIGNMYEVSYSECVQAANINSKYMVQAAIDKWEMAKELDINVVELANEKLMQYQSLVEVGSGCENPIIKTILLDCWINEEVEVMECEE
ncbi:MAG: tetratricopeptide (TPR) repeat protein [Cognaticolwellia sp.]|jgi:tetratricopeptide (TPR) repeat protein